MILTAGTFVEAEKKGRPGVYRRAKVVEDASCDKDTHVKVKFPGGTDVVTLKWSQVRTGHLLPNAQPGLNPLASAPVAPPSRSTDAISSEVIDLDADSSEGDRASSKDRCAPQDAVEVVPLSRPTPSETPEPSSEDVAAARRDWLKGKGPPPKRQALFHASVPRRAVVPEPRPGPSVRENNVQLRPAAAPPTQQQPINTPFDLRRYLGTSGAGGPSVPTAEPISEEGSPAYSPPRRKRPLFNYNAKTSSTAPTLPRDEPMSSELRHPTHVCDEHIRIPRMPGPSRYPKVPKNRHTAAAHVPPNHAYASRYNVVPIGEDSYPPMPAVALRSEPPANRPQTSSMESRFRHTVTPRTQTVTPRKRRSNVAPVAPGFKGHPRFPLHKQSEEELTASEAEFFKLIRSTSVTSGEMLADPSSTPNITISPVFSRGSRRKKKSNPKRWRHPKVPSPKASIHCADGDMPESAVRDEDEDESDFAGPLVFACDCQLAARSGHVTPSQTDAIQCSSCRMWFHLHCTQLGEDESKPSDSMTKPPTRTFWCVQCTDSSIGESSAVEVSNCAERSWSFQSRQPAIGTLRQQMASSSATARKNQSGRKLRSPLTSEEILARAENVELLRSGMSGLSIGTQESGVLASLARRTKES